MSNSVKVFYPRYDLQALEKIIGAKIAELESALPVKLVVIFGSYARGDNTAASDIDLLVIYKGAPRADAFNKVVEIINLPRLEAHVYSETEYQRLKKVVARMITGGKLVFGKI